MIKKLFCFLGIVLLTSSLAFAVNLSQIQIDKELAESNIVYNDNNVVETVGLKVTYDGSSSTQGAITVAREDVGFGTVTLQSPIDTVDGTFYLQRSTSDTIGELVAQIDALSDWSASIDNSDLLYGDDSALLDVVSEVYIGSDNEYEVDIGTGASTSTDPYILSIRVAVSDSGEVIRLLSDAVALPATDGDDIEVYEENASGTSTKLLDLDVSDNTAPISSENIALLKGLEITQGSDLIIKLNGSAAQATDGTNYLYFSYELEDRTY